MNSMRGLKNSPPVGSTRGLKNSPPVGSPALFSAKQTRSPLGYFTTVYVDGKPTVKCTPAKQDQSLNYISVSPQRCGNKGSQAEDILVPSGSQISAPTQSDIKGTVMVSHEEKVGSLEREIIALQQANKTVSTNFENYKVAAVQEIEELKTSLACLASQVHGWTTSRAENSVGSEDPQLFQPAFSSISQNFAAAISAAQEVLTEDEVEYRSRVLGELKIGLLDPDLYKLMNYKYCDIQSFAEKLCQDNKNIKESIKAALKVTGAERKTALLQTKQRLGIGAQRSDSMGNALLFYLLMDAKECRQDIESACRDFCQQGFQEPIAFIERCKEGVSLLASEFNSEDSASDLVQGLQSIGSQGGFTALVSGILLKVCYSSIPEGDVSKFLGIFRGFKQRESETTGEFVTRLDNVIYKNKKIFDSLDKSEDFPNKGAWLEVLKQGVDESSKTLALHICKTELEIPLPQVKYKTMRQALMLAEIEINQYIDQGYSEHPILNIKLKKAPLEKKTFSATDQDPKLTEDLLKHKLCCFHVAGRCKFSADTCQYIHKRPKDVGLIEEDYKFYRPIFPTRPDPEKGSDAGSLPSTPSAADGKVIIAPAISTEENKLVAVPLSDDTIKLSETPAAVASPASSPSATVLNPMIKTGSYPAIRTHVGMRLY